MGLEGDHLDMDIGRSEVIRSPSTPFGGGRMAEFKTILMEAKLRLLRMHFESGVGHIGGNLSSLDTMLYLHHYWLRNDDFFVLSKGHAAGALYVTFWSMGKLSDKALTTFHGEGTHLAGHPIPNWMPDIPVATGSLGHGFPFSIGLAFGKKLKKENGEVFCFMSDGEWEEGANWEGLLFALHRGMNNLVVFVDVNGLQGFGTTDEVASLEPISEKIASFGAQVYELDGHHPENLDEILERRTIGPKFVILRTVKGKGVSFMENRIEWHYWPLNHEQYRIAVEEVKAEGQR